MKRIIIACLVFLGMNAFPASLLAGNNGLIRLDNNLAFSMCFGIELSYYQLDFPEELLTVKANPDDSLTESTKVNFDNGFGYNFRLSLRMLYPRDNSSPYLIVGTDLGLNPLSINAYRNGTYDVTRTDYAGESYAYGQLLPAWYILNPVIGIGIHPVVFEIGFPYNQFTLVTGNDRYGKWEEVDTIRWSGFGQRYYLGIEWMVGVGLSYETYPAEFDSQKAPISLWSLFLSYRIL
ncbi:MAG: hypothetical protein NTZ49_03010 [Candidatus Parcubacteria bacterium]|nr:hypothetical protein [Candidatus Parcubacteria bacterium]